MTKKEYFDTYYPAAKAAGDRFGISPVRILAISGHESGWGTSYSSRVDKNFFGLSASSFYSSEFWDGKTKRKTSDSAGYYRQYTSPAKSFLDFAWLYKNASRYKPAYTATTIEAWAEAHANSGYFTGDKAPYKANIIANAKYFLSLIPKENAIIAKENEGIGAVAAGLLLLTWLKK